MDPKHVFLFPLSTGIDNLGTDLYYFLF